MRLLECRLEQGNRDRQLRVRSAPPLPDSAASSARRVTGAGAQEYGRRLGVKRDELERCWRNSRCNGKPAPYDPAWPLPFVGVLELDFVELTKPRADQAASAAPIDPAEFEAWFASDVAPHLGPAHGGGAEGAGAGEEGREGEALEAIRARSNQSYFTSRQVLRLLGALRAPHLRVEALVVAFARVVDWHAFPVLVRHYTSLHERRSLEHRLGATNLWDETAAVGHYELDLAVPPRPARPALLRPTHAPAPAADGARGIGQNAEERAVCQELLHLAKREQKGDNMVGVTYDDVEFTIQQAWLAEMPRKGRLAFHYCRDAETIEAVRRQGAVDHAGSPYVLDETGRPFPETAHSDLMPSWLRAHCRVGEGTEARVQHEPVKDGWVQEGKLRRTVGKIEDKLGNARQAFAALDRDGSGEVDRTELGVGLFNLGIYLTPAEMGQLFEAADQHGSSSSGSSISADDLEVFFQAYNRESRSNQPLAEGEPDHDAPKPPPKPPPSAPAD